MLLRRSIALLLAAVVVVGSAACTDSKGSGQTGQALDATYTRFDGTSTKFSAFRGKPLIVNFFSSTCLPCQSEMPALERVKQTLGDQVTFLGLDVQDTVDGGKAFIDTVGITWELGRDPDGAVLQNVVHGVGLPTTVVLDGDGRVVITHLGPLDVPELTGQLREHHLIT